MQRGGILARLQDTKSQAIAFGWALAFVFNGFLGVWLWQEHANAREGALREVDSLARIFEAHAERSLMNLDGVLLEVRHYEQETTSDNVKRMIDSEMLAHPFLLDIVVTDAKAKVRAWTRDGVPPNIYDRPYFTFHQSKAESGLFVDSAKLSRAVEGKWFFSMSRRLDDKSEAFRGVVVIMVDIDLFAEGFKKALENSDATMSITHLDGKLMMRLPHMASAMGQSRENIIKLKGDAPSMWNEEARSPFDGQEKIYAYRRIQGFPLVVSASLQMERAYLPWRIALATALILTLLVTGGIAVFTIGLTHSIERRERAMESLEESRAALSRELNFQQILMNAMPLPVLVRGPGGVFIRCNDAFLAWIEKGRDEVLGKTSQELLPLEVQARFDKDFDALAATGGTREFEIDWPKLDGTARRATVFRMAHKGSRDKVDAIISVIVDMTDRKFFEEELRRSNADLEQFSYAVSHDLQEPLRMVSSYVQLLERRYKGRLDKEADEFISFAVDGAKRMHSMIQGLLEFSRVTRKGSELGLVDLNAACEEALANLQVGLDESAAEIVKGPLPKVKGDASQLMRLLQNLIGNAIKYQAEGQKPRVTIEARRDEGFWVISVADNGIGIAPEQISHLFKVFQRLHARDKYPGFGLGLAICRRIVERHGGRIWAESQPGKGSTFRFTLPG